VSAELDAAKLASPTSLNDCMMCNVYCYHYVVVVDFNEVVVPRTNHDYASLVRHIDNVTATSARRQSVPPPHAYIFHNTYYFLDFTPDPLQPAYTRTLSYRRRAPPSALYVSVVRHPVSLNVAHYAPLLHCKK